MGCGFAYPVRAVVLFKCYLVMVWFVHCVICFAAFRRDLCVPACPEALITLLHRSPGNAPHVGQAMRRQTPNCCLFINSLLSVCRGKKRKNDGGAEGWDGCFVFGW